METQNQTNGIDDSQYEKKSKKGFAIRTAATLLIGGILGYFCAWGAKRYNKELLAAFSSVKPYLPKLQIYVFPWIMLIITVVCIMLNEKLLKKSRLQIASWDGEDDAYINIADACLNKVIFISNIQAVGIQLFFAITCYHLMDNLQTTTDAAMIFMAIAIFIASMIVMTLQQNRLVRLTKKYSPEKQGSVYDKNFRNVWFASCDEGERHMIYQASYKTLQLMHKCFSICLSAAAVIGMFASIGILCAVMIGILWLIMSCCYTMECIKLENGQQKV